ncbi:hypothetical protein BH23GEM3_BH23GEM3_05890 [soil metagenome]|jgi:DNA-binding IscR family transcriptional regulator|nr:hypothetical protein [Gemmatimonadota bacterium]
MDETISVRRENRIHFLRRLYELAEADVASFHDGSEIAEDLGIALVEAGRIIRYYEEHGYLRHAGGGGMTLRITAEGIDFVELAPLDP